MYCFSHRFTYFHVFMISLVFNIFNFLTYMYVSRNGLRLYAMTKHTVNCKDCTRSLGGFTEWTGLAMPQEINFTRTSNSATTMSLKSFPVRMWVMTRARVRLISSAGVWAQDDTEPIEVRKKYRKLSKDVHVSNPIAQTGETPV